MLFPHGLPTGWSLRQRALSQLRGQTLQPAWRLGQFGCQACWMLLRDAYAVTFSRMVCIALQRA